MSLFDITKMKYIFVIIVFGMLLSGCATVYNPATGRQEVIFINTAQEVAIGNSVARQVSSQYRISKDPRLNKRLNDIGDKIASVCERQDVKYRFFVIREKELNAFALPGGYVYVHSGLMEKTTDDELAGAIAHELAHIAARHSIKKLQVVMGYNLLMSLAFRGSEAVEVERAVGIAANLMSLRYEREDEREADRLSVRYTYKAGYNPYGILKLLEKFEKLEREDPLSMVVFLRSHPKAAERIDLVRAELIKLGISPRSHSKSTSTNQGVVQDEKFCPACGTYYKDSVKFCAKDGTKLKFTK